MKLLQYIQAEGQDFEWYPTTDEMLRVVANSIKDKAWDVPHRYRDKLTGILDIGAGDGRALRFFKEHCEAHKLMAIDKPVETIFCNPPYSVSIHAPARGATRN